MISVLQLGLIDFASGLEIQQRLIERRKNNQIPDVLLLLEHSPVITLGRNGKSNNVIASPELLKQRGVQLFETDRGGDVTFHGPGQLIGYPIFDLHGFPSTGKMLKHLGAVDYVRRIEEVLIRTCIEYGIPAHRIAGLTGVWTDPAASRRTNPESKIAAIGVHISRSVTSHGFALNVNTDLSFFDLIVPCGIQGKPVTSMQRELNQETDIAQVSQSITRNLGRVFDRQILWVETLDSLVKQPQDTPARPPTELRGLLGEDGTWA